MCGVAGGFAQNSRDIPETPQLQIRYKWRRLLLGRSSVHILFVAGLASSMQRSPIKFGLNWMMKNNMYLNYSIYLLIYVRIMNLIYALINNLSLSVSLSLSIAISDSSTYAEGEGVRCCHDACFIEDSAVTGAYLLLLSSRQAWQEAVPFPTQWLYNSCGIICRELLITYYIIPNIYIYYVCVCVIYFFPGLPRSLPDIIHECTNSNHITTYIHILYISDIYC